MTSHGNYLLVATYDYETTLPDAGFLEKLNLLGGVIKGSSLKMCSFNISYIRVAIKRTIGGQET